MNTFACLSDLHNLVSWEAASRKSLSWMPPCQIFSPYPPQSLTAATSSWPLCRGACFQPAFLPEISPVRAGTLARQVEGPCAWVAFCCLPRHVNRQLDQEWSIWHIDQQLHGMASIYWLYFTEMVGLGISWKGRLQ